MAINASLTGRLRNTSLPKTNALLPLFEAVVNAIESVDEAHQNMESGRVTVEVQRSLDLLSQLEPDPDQSTIFTAPITGFVVSDNGAGFHDANMSSFETLDSEHKLSQGGRGVGRLLWLKAFKRVEVVSSYKDSRGQLKRRTFTFVATAGVSQHSVDDCEDDSSGAEVRLLSFGETYRRSAPKTTVTIARSILEHCLWYFVRDGGAPNIAVIDGEDRIDLISIYDEYMLSSAARERMAVKDFPFDLLHLRLKSSPKNTPRLYWCAANRVVLDENLSGKVRGLHGRLKDSDGEFTYACFLTSPYLDENVRSERIGFDIPESSEGDSEPSLADIRAAVHSAIEQSLLGSLDEVRVAGRKRVEDFVNHKAPRYRPILRHIDEEKLSVDPEISEKELELILHKHYAEIESELLAEGQRVFDASVSKDEDYDIRLRAYLDKLDDVKKSDLAAYVSRRRVLLDLLEREIQAKENGGYVREDVIHNLIMPMRASSDGTSVGASNLWIIDEGLAFHNYLASDIPIARMPITDSTSRKEPDLLALRIYDGPVLVAEGRSLPLASIVVVEFKRPMRNDASAGEEKDPLSQALGYLERVREGGVKTATGRLIPKSEQIPGFCYIVADLTTTVRARCKEGNLRPMPDGLGYFGYNENFGAYIEVISYDRLLNVATQRNRAFFDMLGLPAS
jgi:hypothetical protein